MLATLFAGVTITEMLLWLRKTGLGRKKSPELLPQSADQAKLTKTLSEVRTLLSDIEMGPNIGAGTFGNVYKGQHLVSTHTCVLLFKVCPAMTNLCFHLQTHRQVRAEKYLKLNTANVCDVQCLTAHNGVQCSNFMSLLLKCMTMLSRSLEGDERGSEDRVPPGSWVPHECANITRSNDWDGQRTPQCRESDFHSIAYGPIPVKGSSRNKLSPPLQSL